MGFAYHSFPNRRQQAEQEAGRLARELLERVRLAHLRQPEGVTRQPVLAGTVLPRAAARAMIMPSPMRLMSENPEVAIIALCLAFFSVGALHHATF